MTNVTGRRIRLVVAFALLAAVATTAPPLKGAWAQEAGVHKRRRSSATTTTTTATTAPSAEQLKIEKLSRQLEEMQKQQAELMSQLKDLKQQVAIQAPAAAGAPGAAAGAAGGAATTAALAPMIGQHVAQVENDLAQTRKDLATNLGVHIHGLVDGSYEKNLNNPGAGIPNVAGLPSPKVNALRAFDTDPSGFELTQGNIHIDRTVDGGVGFVTDLNFGKVAEVLTGATHYSNSATPPAVSEFDPTQAYATYTVPVGSGINLSAGKFVTLLGEETIKTYSALDFNESGSYIFTLGIPFTHTGLRANYVFSEQLAGTLGVNNGWDDPANVNSGANIEGQIAFTPSQALALTVSGMYGPDQANHGNSKRGIIDPIVTWHTPLTGLQLIGEYIYAHEDGPVAVTPFGTGINAGPNPLFLAPINKGVTVIPHGVDWQATAAYLVYDLNDKLQFALRGEWFRDSDGARTGLRQTLYEGTFTTSYKVADGLTLRGEYRHDESSSKPFYSNTPTPASFRTPGSPFGPTLTRAGQDTFLAAAIYAF